MLYHMARKRDRQINFRVDEEFLCDIEVIQQNTSPVPSMSEAIRQAVADRAYSIKRTIGRQSERKRASVR